MNRVPTSANLGGVPFERWFGKNDLNRLRVFGCKAWASIIPKQNKLDPRAKSYIMVGYAINGYRLWNPIEDCIIISRDVVFDENNFEFEKENMNNHTKIEYEQEEEMENGNYKTDKEEKQENRNEESRRSRNIVEEENENYDGDNHKENIKDKANGNGLTKRSGRKTNLPKYLEDYQIYSTFCLLIGTQDPKTFEEAIQDKKWRDAIMKEMNSLKKMNTWSIVDKPENAHIIDTKWVFRTKEEGIKKARLVVRGFQQHNDNQFQEAYAPVARLSTIRMMLSKIVNDNLPLKKFDIPTAFLNGKLKEDVYIRFPKGVKEEKGKVLKLNMSL